MGPNEYFNLRWPRPKPTPGPSFGPKVFQRTWNDTCGLYTWSIDTNPTDGRGPPPHIHWADDEWFFPRGAGSEVRIYTTQNPQVGGGGMHNCVRNSSPSLFLTISARCTLLSPSAHCPANHQTFLPGMLPGITVPTVPMGFTVVTDNQVGWWWWPLTIPATS